MKIRIRRINKDIPLPMYGTPDAACFDIAINEDVTIEPKQIKLLHTGLYIEAPKNYFLAIVPRSSTPKRTGLSFPHSIGVIDPDYSGPDDELLIQVHNFTDETVNIKRGDRVAQGLFLPVEQVEWEETDQLKETTRGGFGSTGLN